MWWIVSGGKESSHGRGGLLLPCNFIESHLNLKTELITLSLHLWLYLFNNIKQFWFQDIRSDNASKDLDPLWTKEEVNLSLWLGEELRSFIFSSLPSKGYIAVTLQGNHLFPQKCLFQLMKVYIILLNCGDILRKSIFFKVYLGKVKLNALTILK